MSFKHDILNKMTLAGKYKILQEEPLAIEEIVLTVKKNGKKSSDFQKLFFCYRKPYPIDLFALGLLADAILEGFIDIETEFIVKAPNIDLLINDIGRGRINESGEHQGMKAWLIDFLKTKAINATEEVSLLGYQVDVACMDKGIFIECGDTEPKKIFTIMFYGYSIGLLQYDSEHILWMRPSTGFKKRFNKDAKDYLGLC